MHGESDPGLAGERGVRLVIVHADDIGMCHGANAAFEALLPLGIMTSASVMAPCPWFLEAVDICRHKPGVDVGVHITLTSEWRTYRWKPISTTSASSGLLDSEGYLPHTLGELYRKMDPDAAIHEMRAQVEISLDMGLSITHIDTHMGAVMHPLLLPGYAQLAIDYGVPIMLPEPEPALVEAHKLPAEVVLVARQQRQRLLEHGIPLINHVRAGPEYRIDAIGDFCRALDALPPGITHLYFHPCKACEEIKAITPRWRTRVADFEVASSQVVRDYVANSDLTLVSYRELSGRLEV